MVPTLRTERLLLRRFRQEDAAAVAALAGSWYVARMLARVPQPYTHDMAKTWIATHERLVESGEEYIFCIELDGETVGSIGLQRSRDGVYGLGCWVCEPWWGEGLASEAANRIVRWAFEELGGDGLVSGHLADNPASGRVLQKCGFRYTGDSEQQSVARGGLVSHRDFALDRAEWTGWAEMS